MQPKNFHTPFSRIERNKRTVQVDSKKFSSAQQAIFTTILYSDIFSFPLDRDELWKFLISEKKITRQVFNSSLKNLKQIVYKDGYYCLKGHEAIITKRNNNLSEVVKKMKLARSVSEKLSVIPSILFIGISGGLAAGSATAHDDIDLVIITRKDTLFATRLLTAGILESMGIRRARNQKQTADKVCVNLLFDETAIAWSSDKRDIYTAREIAQIVPLFERNSIYSKFIKANSWMVQFLPNFSHSRFASISFRTSHESNISAIVINPFTESLCRVVQLSWMRRHQTREVITKHMLALHPNDYRILTLRQLRLKARQFGLLTKF